VSTPPFPSPRRVDRPATWDLNHVDKFTHLGIFYVGPEADAPARSPKRYTPNTVSGRVV
jgi:hypothetical protein